MLKSNLTASATTEAMTDKTRVIAFNDKASTTLKTTMCTYCEHAFLLLFLM